jgi:hypothetical protein
MGCSVGGVRCSVGGGQNVVVDGTTEDAEYTEGDGVFWEGEVPSEPRDFCGSRGALVEPRMNADGHGF